MSRRLVRESALQSLFQMNMAQVSASDAIQHVLEETVGKIDKAHLEKVVNGTFDNQSEIDRLIQEYSVGWELDRMPTVDLTILRLAIYELVFEPETPIKVVLNEAIELAKAFSTNESGKFVNGVLANIARDIDRLRGSINK